MVHLFFLIYKISIHSLRMEGDTDATSFCKPLRHFNPLPPHGGRLRFVVPHMRQTDHFNPLPPHGGRPGAEFSRIPHNAFQSTPSAWRETMCSECNNMMLCHFNPLPPHGGRRQMLQGRWRLPPHFNPLPPHGGRRTNCTVLFCASIHFNPLPPHGGRRNGPGCTHAENTFQSTPSAWRETRNEV